MTRERGFTLIELMVALVISSLLVGMILAIFLRMSLAYRSQQQVASVQQVLAAARAAFETDAKHAGMYMSDGLQIADEANPRSPVQVINSSAGPDEVAFFYVDASTGQRVTGGDALAGVNVTAPGAFAAQDMVVLSTPASHALPGRTAGIDAHVARYSACVLRVATTSAILVTFDLAPPWGNGSNTHCATPAADTMLYKLVARRYRIDPDPARAGEGVLQVSPTGQIDETVSDWLDLAYGFTDIQIATRFFDGDGLDADGDGDPARDWFSGNDQTGMTGPIALGTLDVSPIRMSISLVARTDRNIDGVTTERTPSLTDVDPDHNPLGDRAEVDLTTTADPTLQGNRVYRYTTFEVDLRNLGAGR